MATGIFLPIVSQFIDKGTAAAAKELKSLQTVSQKAGFAINKAAVPAAAALTGLAVAGLAAAKAAAADAEAQTKLAGQIRRTTGSTQQQIDASEDLISSLSMSAAVADDALRPALSSLVTGTKDLGTAQRLLKVALDVSAGAGLDLQQTSEALSKGFAGNTRALASLSPELKVLIREGATFSEVLEVLEKNYKGAGEESANTAAGGFRKFSIAIDEAQEAIGKALLPIVAKITPILVDFAKVVERNGTLIAIVAASIGVFAGALIAAKVAFVVYNAIAAVTTAFNTALAISFTAVQVSTVVGIASAIAGAAVLATLVVKYKSATSGVTTYGDATRDAGEETGFLKNQIDAAGRAADQKRQADAAAEEAAEKAAAAAKQRADDLKQKIKQIRDSFRGDFTDALNTARDTLKQAEKSFADFASTVSDSITGVLGTSLRFTLEATLSKATRISSPARSEISFLAFQSPRCAFACSALSLFMKATDWARVYGRPSRSLPFTENFPCSIPASEKRAPPAFFWTMVTIGKRSAPLGVLPPTRTWTPWATLAPSYPTRPLRDHPFNLTEAGYWARAGARRLEAAALTWFVAWRRAFGETSRSSASASRMP